MTIKRLAHIHKDERGLLHVCYHKCKTALSDWGFWLGVTLSFPLEHWLWHHWPFVWLTRLLGLE